MLVAFRTDASPRIGLGHLCRCLSLAQALAAVGMRSVFICRPSSVDIAGILAPDGVALRWLDAAALNDEADLDLQADARATLKALEGLDTPTWVVIDHYKIDATWHAQVGNALQCQVAAIDDLANRPLDVDLLIDHNLAPAGEQHRRYRTVLKREPRWLCGPRFALLSATYSGLPDFVVKPVVESIGIFLGGTDPTSHSPIALKAVRDAGFNGPVEIVSTTGNPSLPSLQAVVADDPNAELLLNLPDLRAFYQRHDVQIGAGGGASWERCAVGTPTLTLCLADNQLAVIPMLVGIQATICPSSPDANAISEELQRVLPDRSLRQTLSDRSRALVDGLGAIRVAISLVSETGLELRKASREDAAPMWAWRNNPSIRIVSRQAAVIPFEEHLAWLDRTLASSERSIWIGLAGKRPVGVIRFDALAIQGHFEVSLYLDPALHGLGLGRKLLLAGEATLADTSKAIIIEAEVLADNSASRNMFLAMGYVQTSPSRYLKALPQS